MLILKQSTAVDVLIGPFVDSTDGYTAETGVSPAVKLSKNGQTLAAKNDVTTPTHDADGYYNCELDATDTNTVGTLVLTVVGSATSLPVRHEFQVVEEAVYDAMYGASATGPVTSSDLPANFGDLSITATTGRVDINTNNDKTGYSISGTLTTLDALDTAQDSQHATTQGLVTTVDTVVDGIQTDLSNGTDGLGAIKTAVDAIPTSNPTAAAIADAVLDEALSGHTTAGTLGKAVADIETDATAILADTNELQTNQGNWVTATGFATSAALTTVEGKIDTIDGIVDSILVDTAEIGAAGAGLTAVPWNAAWDAEVQSECADALTAYDPPTNTEMVAAFTEIKGATWSTTDTLENIRDELVVVDGNVDAVLTDTGTTIPAQISGLNDPTAAAIADAVWEEAIADHSGTAGSTAEALNAAGAAGDPWTTSLPGAYSAGQAGHIIGNLNDLSAAEVNAEVDTALADIHLDHLFATDYDPASKPGTATALFNELVESDAGVSRFTANALEQAPSGGGGGDATAANQTTIIGHLTDIKGATWDSSNSLEAISDDLATADANIDAVLVDTGTTIPAQISGLNNLSSADVNAACDTALADYDAPTKAELDAGLAALNDPTAAAIRAEIDSNSTQLAAIVADTNEIQADWANGGRLDLLLDAIKVVTDALPDSGALTSLATAANLATVDGNVDAILVDTDTTIPALIAALNDISVSDILTTQMTESYAADGTAPTLAQAVFLIQQFLFERSVSGTTTTIKQLDGSTTAATLTLDDATSPTSITRAS